MKCLSGLDEVVLDEALQDEEGNLLITSNAQNLLQLGIGQNDALVVGLVQVVKLDICVNLASNVGARQLGTTGNTQEIAHLIGDLGRLCESGWLSTSIGTLALSLLNQLLHALVVLGQGLQARLNLLDSGGKSGGLCNQVNQRRCRLRGRSLNNRLGGSNNGLLLNGLGHLGGRSSSRGRRNGLLCRHDHLMNYKSVLSLNTFHFRHQL